MNNFRPKMTDHSQDVEKPLVSKYMVHASQLITFKKETPILEALETLLENRITGAPVLDDHGRVVGLIDDKDCLNILMTGGYYNQPIAKDTVSTYMSNVMKTISVDVDIFMVANTFLTTPYKRLLVLDKNEELAGQISRRDILTAIKELNKTKW